MKSNIITSAIVALSMQVPAHGATNPNRVSHNTKAKQSSMLSRLSPPVSQRAESILKNQFCGSGKLSIKYSPLLDKIGICRENPHNIRLVAAEIEKCRQINKNIIACQIDIPSEEKKYCIRINEAKQKFKDAWRGTCKQ